MVGEKFITLHQVNVSKEKQFWVEENEYSDIYACYTLLLVLLCLLLFGWLAPRWESVGKS